MNDQCKHVCPEYGTYQNRNQEREALEFLNMIHNTSFSTRSSHKSSNNFKLPLLFNTGIIDFNEDNDLIFGGRNVIVVDRISPLKVSKRIVKPQFTNDGSFKPNPEWVLKKLFRMQDLSNLLLLITPTVTGRKLSDEHVLHGYEVNTQLHLGVTILTTEERELILREHNPKNYSLIFCTGYINLEDAFMKSPIRDQIFHVLQHKPSQAICAWNGDCRIILHYHSCDPKPSDIIISPKPEILIIRPRSSSTVGDESLRSQSAEGILELNNLRQSAGEEKASPLKLSTDSKGKFSKAKRQEIKVGKGEKSLMKGTRPKISKKKKLKDNDIAEIESKNISINEDQSYKRYTIPKKRNGKQKKKRTTTIIPNANITPAERKALVGKLYKEKLLKRERKWKPM